MSPMSTATTACIAINLLFSQLMDAQSWSLGPAVVYGDDIKESGIQIRSYYNLPGDRICFGPEFSHFFSSTENHQGEERRKQLNEVNFNVHYIFELSEKWGFYPLVGANLSFEKEEIRFKNGGAESTNNSALGANLGVGFHHTLNKWLIFGEFDHLFSELSQNSLVLGTLYTFSKATEAPHSE